MVVFIEELAATANTMNRPTAIKMPTAKPAAVP
jgi:hypothetical protein